MRYYDPKRRDNPGDFFPLPKAVFRLGLDYGEIAVLAFLMYCEDRKTFRCHPSYATIGSAIGMSNNTVKKYVDSLEKKGFIYTEPTMVRTRDGRAHNGISGLLKYFATRPGVEKLGDGWLNEPVSKAQEDLIMRFTEMHKGCRRLQEYGDYNTKRTKGAASEFISAVIENFPELLSDKTYLDYIATRPRVERIEGTHGLFSDHDVALDLYEESDRLREFNGNVFTVIVSLKREDAERLGYNTAERWRELARSKIDLVAKEHGIPLGSLKWYLRIMQKGESFYEEQIVIDSAILAMLK